ncbi:uncharacterized protein [Acropora muricata]|uniref:uncharacterized protein n=1 Tax=Acropora muricata TaxID=159855 RepID=UPI0034E3D695
MKYFPFIVLAFTSQLTVTPTLADSCKNPTVLKREGSFQSPNYPNHYPNGATCQWIIEIPHDIIAQKPFITLEFKNFNVEMHPRCYYDKVLVYDGWESNNILMGSFCGHNTPSPIHATSGKMLVKFISNKAETATGFNATFEFTSLLVPPLIVDMTASHFLVKGEKTELRCSASGLPNPNVMWTRLGVELIEGRRFAVLSLNNVTKADQGIYRCTANNSQGQKSATMKLTVVACPDYCVCFSLSYNLVGECRRANLTSIPSGTLRDFTRLDLSENYIENITASDFRSFWNLSYLKLSNNKIKRLSNGTFREAKKIQQLHLDNNEISHLEGDSFTGLEGTLNLLYLSENKLTYLARESFHNLRALKYLLLNGNLIKSLDSYTFSSLSSLELLVLSENKLTNLARELFHNIRALKYLFLNVNLIKSLDSYTFSSLSSLELLNLADNPLQELNHHAFYIANSSLHTIYLMKTSMERINLTAFEGQQLVKAYISPDHLTEGFAIKDNMMLFWTLARIGFAHGNWSYRAPCPTGTFVPPLKSYEFWTALLSSCIPCPPGGFYSDGIAVVGENCFPCNNGTYVPPERAPGKNVRHCIVCPTGTRTDLESGYRACKCIDAFHRTMRFGPCEKCPSKGLNCVDESVSLKQGYYWQWDSEINKRAYEAFAQNLKIESDSYWRNTSSYNGTLPKPYQCPRAKSCEGGLESKCAKGYTGPLCEVCEGNYYKRVLACKLCPSGTWVIVQLSLLGVAVLVLIIILIWSGRRRKSNDNTGKRPMVDILLARLKIVIGFYQVTSGIIEGFAYIKWPSSLAVIGDYTEVIQLNILSFVPLHCLFPSWKQNAISKMYLMLASNASVILFAVVSFWIRKLFLLWSINKEQSSKRRIELSTTKEFLYRNVFLFLFITYPSTCSAILRIFPLACHELCSESSCTQYLKADYSIKCEGDEYNFVKLFAFAALSYIVVLPGLVFLALWRRRRQQLSPKRNVRDFRQKEENNPFDPEFGKHGNTETAEENNKDDEGNEDNPRNDQPNSESELLSGMSFLYENYNEDAWYWELVEVIRKLVLTCGIILIGRESRTYVGLASICSGLFAIAFAFRKPIRDKFEDKLQLTSLLVIFLNLGIGVILKIPKESVPSDVDQYVDTLLVNILVVGANVLVIFLVVGRYLAVLIHNIVLWRQNPQCSASCCITIFLSLGELSSGVNSVAGGVRKTNLRVNLGIGGVGMPSMRAAVNDNVGFEIEETDDDNAEKDKKEGETKRRHVIFKYKNKKSSQELEMKGR